MMRRGAIGCGAALQAAAVALLVSASPVRAEIGPCVPDGSEGFANRGLVCGSGPGGAHVIDGTISPDGSKALAWRAERSPPTEMPGEDEKIALLVVRLKDGHVLFTAETEYWDNTHGHANRRQEYAAWSTDSRFLIEAYDTRFETEALRGFSFDANGELIAQYDLMKPIRSAVNKAARRIEGADRMDFAVSIKPTRSKLVKDGVYGLPAAKIGRDGRAQITIYLWVPKEGPYYYYRVDLALPRKPGGQPAVRDVRRAEQPPDDAR